MTVKQFFKSNAFKCILVLFSILILCGALLTLAYGFLKVSAGERLQRAIASIYPDDEVIIYGYDDSVIDENEQSPKSIGEAITYDNAEILEAYKIEFENKDETHYLVKSKGLHGYSEGSVTCWVAINVDEENNLILNVVKVQVGESAGQTFMNKITDNMLGAYKDADFEKGIPDFNVGTKTEPTEYVSTGASLSSTAINNSVNGAVKYVNEEILGNAGGER